MKNIKIEMNTNNVLGIVKAIPVVLGLGIITYQGINKVINNHKDRKLNKVIAEVVPVVKNIIQQGPLAEEDNSVIERTIRDYAKDKDVTRLEAVFDTYNVMDNVNIIRQCINEALKF